jgi:glycosyltransferase involved in cell wall biosynthesis
MKILAAISGLGPGGAERVCTTLANHWATKGHDVSVMTLSGTSEPPFYDLYPLVQRLALNLLKEAPNAWNGACNAVRRILRMRDVIGQVRPDVVLSFGNRMNVLTALACWGTSIPAIVSERCNPELAPMGNWIWKSARWRAYRRAARIVVQTQRARRFFTTDSRLATRTIVIPNPICDHATRPQGRAFEKQKTIISIGRLTAQKRHSLLIDAFARLAHRYPDWNLQIWGAGELHSQLEFHIRQLDLEGRIRLCGLSPAIADELQRASIFALTSDFEGFPNALAEAMHCGLPVISCDCPHGPAELIRHGQTGLLVECGNAASFSDGLRSLMDDALLRTRLGENARQALQPYSLDAVSKMWEEVFTDIVHGLPDRRLSKVA